MLVNKKFDRFKQWAGEKMGGEARTTTTEDFKALELEMNLRHEGMDKLHKSMSLYVKAIGKKSEGEGADKQLPIGYLGSTMVQHGQDFSADSEFGHCLLTFGRANEAISRCQESYVNNATTLWLESLEKSLAQMKEYQTARKRLEARRLAYDTSLAKVQKAKKEDFRVEEELRAQKAKYEESSEDVGRRMEDIKDAEMESIIDLTRFLEEELDYHETCRNVLLDLKAEWPSLSGRHGDFRKQASRGRPIPTHTFGGRVMAPEEMPEPLPPRTTPKLAKPESFATYRRESPPPRPTRQNTAPASPHARHNWTPPNSAGLDRQQLPDFQTRLRDHSPSEKKDYSVRAAYEPPSQLTSTFPQVTLRSLTRVESAPQEANKSPFASRSRGVSPPSPQSPFGNDMSRTDDISALSGMGLVSGGSSALKKAPPPPPPSRAKKPPPPPPMKRAAFSSPAVPLSPGYN